MAGTPCPKCGYVNRPKALLCNLCKEIFRRERRSRRAEQRFERRRDFYTQIASNKKKSIALIGLFLVLVAVVGFVSGEILFGDFFALASNVRSVTGAYDNILADQNPRAVEPKIFGFGLQAGLLGMGLATIFAAIYAAATYYRGSSFLLKVSGARPVTHDTEPRLFNVVEEMKLAAGVPMPKVYLIESDAPNAFATGRDPQHAAIAVTSGLVAKLNREELQGVIGHEMSHIRNFDIRFMMLAGALVGAIALLADILRRWFFYGGARTGRRRGGGPGGMLLIPLAIALVILAPLAAKLLQMAVSREREFLADASAVQLTRNPNGLIRALEKIGSDKAKLDKNNRATQHLYLVNPLRAFGMKSKALLSTHPPLEARLSILRSMAV